MQDCAASPCRSSYLAKVIVEKENRVKSTRFEEGIFLIAAASGAYGSRDRTGNVHQSNDRISRWTIAARIERHAKPRGPANFR